MGDGVARTYEIAPEPDPEGRAAIVAALEQVAAETADDAHTTWARAGREEVVDDGLG
jgi:hypothetical protein